ncbi:MAG: ribose 5-phosphate isomerase B [Raoultibacter sp.]
MKISLASDHAGFDQKRALACFLEEVLGHEVIDRGPATEDRVDYPDFAVKVAHDVAEGKADRGVLVCGTGIGMALAADKVAGCRAANIITPEFAALCRQHNDANIITLSGRFVDQPTNEDILRAFLTTPFEGGRHTGRVEKIMALDTVARP